MSLRVILHPDAVQDLYSLQSYLAERFSKTNAAGYAKRIVAACHAIGKAPYRGTRRDDIRPGLRSIGFEHRVTITFEVMPDHVVIAGIFYGGRSLR